MKLVVIGAVAAGTSLAAKARRQDETLEIDVFEKGTSISYAVCGIPYAVGGEVDDFKRLEPRDVNFFKDKYNVIIHTEVEVVEILKDEKKIVVEHVLSGERNIYDYDVLAFATGTRFHIPPPFNNQTFENLFQIKEPQTGMNVQNYIQKKNAKSAIVIGAGYVGLEMAEQLKKAGLDVSILVKSAQALKGFDLDVAKRIEFEMKKQGIVFHKNTKVTSILSNGESIEALLLDDDEALKADVYVLATGVQPNTSLAEQMGVKLGPTGAIQVNEKMQTSLEGVYAVGDVAEKYSHKTHLPIWIPLATHANREGRIAGEAITGGNPRNPGISGTSILRFFDLTIAQTGLTETKAKALGFDIEVLYNIKNDRPEYISSDKLFIKAVADRKNREFLGAQIIGTRGVDKRIDVFATALYYHASVDDLVNFDLAYSPIYSTVRDPIQTTGMALGNGLDKHKTILPTELDGDTFQLIDVRNPNEFQDGHIEGAKNIPLGELRKNLERIDSTRPVVVYCNTGVSANAAQNILKKSGFEEVYNLNGGFKSYIQSVKKKES
ncbi:MAG: FAD-dependent oxidoreductase [Streptococcaceae bacterium]|jgi:NADPH-dependent 2,4-dienoyl-CoA reductase/sulfur reductase-like enzyme|nr:FAD-dependent oxidoreductase [Streptococcaceae bacterium]